MALKNEASNYLVIDNIDINNGTVQVSYYQDKKHKNDGDTEYLKARHDTLTIPGLSDYAELTPSTNGTISDNLKAICYCELSDLPDFIGWTKEIKDTKVRVVEDIRIKIANKKAKQ